MLSDPCKRVFRHEASFPFLLLPAGHYRKRLQTYALAIAFAASLVVFTVSTFMAARAQIATFAQQLIRTYDLMNTPDFATEHTISAHVDSSLEAHAERHRHARSGHAYRYRRQ